MLVGQRSSIGYTVQSSDLSGSAPDAAGYPDSDPPIYGLWSLGSGGRSEPVINPATGRALSDVAYAEIADLERAVLAAGRRVEI